MAEDNDVQRTLGRIEGKMDQILKSGEALKAYTEKEVQDLKNELKDEKSERKAEQEKSNARIGELEKLVWKVTGGSAVLTVVLTYGAKIGKFLALSASAGGP